MKSQIKKTSKVYPIPEDYKQNTNFNLFASMKLVSILIPFYL